MDNELVQKNHGLPGVGVTGNVGEAGERGNSIYVGIDVDFFDNEPISMDRSIIAAVRLKGAVDAYNTALKKFNEAVADDNIIAKAYLNHIKNQNT